LIALTIGIMSPDFTADGRVVMGGKDVHVHIVAQMVGKLQAWK